MWDSFPADDKTATTFEDFSRKVEEMVTFLENYNYEGKQLSFTFFELQDADTGTVFKDKHLTVTASERKPKELVLTTDEEESVHLFR